jgi:hypothetical protein
MGRLSPVTDRTRTDVWRECAAILIGLGVVVGLAAAFGHYTCHHVPANVASPEPGTPRADYCSVTDAGSGWMMFAVPLLLAAVAFAAVRGRRDRVVAAAIGITVIAVGNAALIMFLSPEYTI